jgi:hypothetical protein
VIRSLDSQATLRHALGAEPIAAFLSSDTQAVIRQARPVPTALIAPEQREKLPDSANNGDRTAGSEPGPVPNDRMRVVWQKLRVAR